MFICAHNTKKSHDRKFARNKNVEIVERSLNFSTRGKYKYSYTEHIESYDFMSMCMLYTVLMESKIAEVLLLHSEYLLTMNTINQFPSHLLRCDNLCEMIESNTFSVRKVYVN